MHCLPVTSSNLAINHIVLKNGFSCNHFEVASNMMPSFSIITQNNSHCGILVHSRSPILVLIESSYETSYFILNYTVSKLLRIIGKTYAFDKAIPLFNIYVRGETLNERK